MIDHPEVFQRAVSFDWESLLPVAFFVLYGIAQFLGSRKKGGAAEEEGDPEEDPMEKARQIREEIRRKIEERTRAHGDPSTRTDPATGRGYGYNPNLPESKQQRPRTAPPLAKPARQQRPVVVHQAQPVASSPPVAGIQEQLLQQRKRLREAQQQREAALVQARKMTRQASVKRQSDSRKLFEFQAVRLDAPEKLRADVFKGLRQPNSLRKAILYREILDPPVGLR